MLVGLGGVSILRWSSFSQGNPDSLRGGFWWKLVFYRSKVFIFAQPLWSLALGLTLLTGSPSLFAGDGQPPSVSQAGGEEGRAEEAQATLVEPFFGQKVQRALWMFRKLERSVYTGGPSFWESFKTIKVSAEKKAWALGLGNEGQTFSSEQILALYLLQIQDQLSELGFEPRVWELVLPEGKELRNVAMGHDVFGGSAYPALLNYVRRVQFEVAEKARREIHGGLATQKNSGAYHMWKWVERVGALLTVLTGICMAGEYWYFGGPTGWREVEPILLVVGSLMGLLGTNMRMRDDWRHLTQAVRNYRPVFSQLMSVKQVMDAELCRDVFERDHSGGLSPSQ